MYVEQETIDKISRECKTIWDFSKSPIVFKSLKKIERILNSIEQQECVKEK